jgi:intracellular multiplication protein IcmB
MTTLGNEKPRDNDTAKRRAQAMRARLKDLGHDIPLTHAYEMLATSCGFRNWPTMKASLSASTAYTDLGSPHDISVTAGRAVFLNDDGKPWELPESEDWGFELIFGPPGKGKASFAQALDLQRLEQHLEYSRSSLPRVTTIDIEGVSHAFIDRVQELISRKSRHRVKHVRLHANRSQSVNIFDTPLGLRKPAAAQRQALATFIMAILDLPDRDPRHHEFHQISLAAVDDVYARLAGKTVGSSPRPYKQGMSLELDHDIKALLPPDANTQTWWGIADAFFEARHIQHAAMAQRFAVPKLADFLPMLVDVGNFDRDFVSGLEAAIARHIHSFPILSEETDVIAGSEAILAVDISEFSRSGRSARDLGLAFLLARQAFAGNQFFMWSEIEAVPNLYRSHHASRWHSRQGGRDRGLLVYDDVHRLGAVAIKQIERDIEDRRKRQPDIRLSTQGYLGLSKRTVELVSRTLFLGVGSKSEASRASAYGLPSAWLDACERRLIGPGRDGLTFAVAVKNFTKPDPHFVTMAIGPEGLWASVTNSDDILVRTMVAEEIGLLAARRALGKRFPGGSAGTEIELRLNGHDVKGLPRSVVDEMRTHVIEKLAKEIASLAR